MPGPQVESDCELESDSELEPPARLCCQEDDMIRHAVPHRDTARPSNGDPGMTIDTTAAYDDQNVFAKILRGELPAQKVYEDDKTLAEAGLLNSVVQQKML